MSIFKRRAKTLSTAWPEGDLKFRSRVGEQPWFFVPDTGTPGGSAVLVDPDGRRVSAWETQLSPPKATLPNGEPWVTRWGPRVGFRVPAPFSKVGVYKFVVTQDDAVAVYEINVRESNG
jgi:hypothetical protein